MLRNVLSLTIVAVLLSAVVLSGCDLFNSGDEVFGRVKVHLTDAPLDGAEAVDVSIIRVELLGNERVVLSDEPQMFNLLELQDGVTALLADELVPAGRYHQLRLIVDDEAEVTYGDGVRVKFPSGAQTGIKVNFKPFEITSEDDIIELTVDFDAEKSFVPAGGSGKYIFKPVIKAEAQLVNGDAVELPEDDDA